MSYIIRAENVGKKYSITRARNYKMARDVLADAGKQLSRSLRGIFRKNRSTENGKRDTLWALRNISFDIQPGQSVGIIGRNGAGKSTLLKIISRITTPSEGRFRVRGRVGSLLEVGTGFHPELTGRENVYLNGAILGMKKIEIDRLFDEIVAFSETETFLDTPVKFFSSGMRMRLAFSVAAHLDPEILLIDEILAVGDIAFQRKSLDKMNSVASSGRTILFISHSMAAIKSLCQSAMLLDAGKIIYNGDVDTAIDIYTKRDDDIPDAGRFSQEPLPNTAAQIISAELLDNQGTLTNRLAHDGKFSVRAKLLIQTPSTPATVCLNIYNPNLDVILSSYDFESDEAYLLPRKKGIYQLEINIPANVLVPGQYFLGFDVSQTARWGSRLLQRIEMACPFEVFDNGSSIARINAQWRGVTHPVLDWKELSDS